MVFVMCAGVVMYVCVQYGGCFISPGAVAGPLEKLPLPSINERSAILTPVGSSLLLCYLPP